MIDDRYVVLGRLGRGPRALEVADALHPGRTLCLRLGGKDEGDAIEREFALLASLRHDGIPRAHDLGRHARRRYFTQDRVAGDSLVSRIRAGALAESRQVRRVALALVGVVAYLHERDVLHLDIKPGNVVVAADGRASLVDFETASRAGTAKRSRGTPGYQAPEDLRGAAPAETSDLFALGATLYAAAEARTPFGPGGAGGPVDPGEATTGERPPPPFESGFGARDPELAASILALLDPDPSRRPSAHALRARLAGDERPRLPGSSFVGWGADVEALVEQARTGPRQIVAVTGAAGWGKSRMLETLSHAAAARGLAVLATSAALRPAADRLRAIAAVAALVVIDEADRLESAAIDALAAAWRSGRATMMVFAPGDPDIVARLGGSASQAKLHRFEIPPLTETDSKVLVRSVLGRPAPGSFVTELHRTTGGNPRAIQSALHALHRSGKIEFDGTGWRVL